MLIKEEIKFPITFYFWGPKSNLTFTDPENGLWDSGSKTGICFDYFIKNHNKQNPDNNFGIDYHYKMADNEKSINNRYEIEKMINGYSVKRTGYIHVNGGFIQSGASENKCKIEDMPLGATLIAIQDESGGWDEVVFTPRRVEVHDDIICLLSCYGYARGYSPSGKTYGAEINIKRGTMVKFK